MWPAFSSGLLKTRADSAGAPPAGRWKWEPDQPGSTLCAALVDRGARASPGVADQQAGGRFPGLRPSATQRRGAWYSAFAGQALPAVERLRLVPWLVPLAQNRPLSAV